VKGDLELLLENAGCIREARWRMARYAQGAAETLDATIEDEDLNGMAETMEVREAL
jgi:hypothetical protein